MEATRRSEPAASAYVLVASIWLKNFELERIRSGCRSSSGFQRGARGQGPLVRRHARSLQHLEVAVRVAKRRDRSRPMADGWPTGLPALSSIRLTSASRISKAFRRAFRSRSFAAADHLFRRNAFFAEDAHGIDAPPDAMNVLESLALMIGEQLQPRLVDHLHTELSGIRMLGAGSPGADDPVELVCCHA